MVASVRVYFAHPMITYGSVREEEALEAIAKRFPVAEIINPADLGADVEMREFFQLVRDADVVVFIASTNGTIGRGVHSEVEHAKRLGKKVFLLVSRTGEFHASFLIEQIPNGGWTDFAYVKEMLE